MLAAFLIAMAVTVFTTPLVLKLAKRWGAVAIPRDRDVHQEPTPRLGGMAIYAGVMVAVIAAVSFRHWQSHGVNGWNGQIVGLLLAGSFIAAMGIVDDLKDLRALYQAGAILIAGVILILFNVRVDGITNPFAAGESVHDKWLALHPVISVVGTLFWVFLVTKTVDAIEGLDGLASGVCAISAGTLALLAGYSHMTEGATIAPIAAAVAGACIGFLRHNFNPAKIFMSTIGAQFLGLMLAGISIMGTFKVAATISVAIPLLVLGVPIFDYGIVILKRVLSGSPITLADKRHIHHRLLDKGLSHRQAVWVIYGCTAALCAVALILFRATH
jgi:UDP-GlcNAc:undecaprenyl-phosphate GlcNAc-1-phosphate transferase